MPGHTILPAESQQPQRVPAKRAATHISGTSHMSTCNNPEASNSANFSDSLQGSHHSLSGQGQQHSDGARIGITSMDAAVLGSKAHRKSDGSMQSTAAGMTDQAQAKRRASHNDTDVRNCLHLPISERNCSRSARYFTCCVFAGSWSRLICCKVIRLHPVTLLVVSVQHYLAGNSRRFAYSVPM